MDTAATTSEPNRLYFGDCLEVMRRDIDSESVDLIYLDPPFNSKRLYNAFIKGAQWVAFNDTWQWHRAVDDFHEVASQPRYASMMEGLRMMLGEGSQIAYLSYMANRLIECHRVLKRTGSIYLHCDPTMSHYLKAVMDAVFGRGNFRNEIVWRRTGSHNSAKRFGPIHDVILFYAKSEEYRHNQVFTPYLKGHVDMFFKKKDAKGRYWTNSIHGAGTRKGASGKPWKGFDPTKAGRHWAIPKDLVLAFGIDPDLPLHAKLDALYNLGLIDLPAKGLPTYRQYLDHSPGHLLQDIWAFQPHTKGSRHDLDDPDSGIDEEVRWLPPRDKKERTGYPTQKPIGLLKRIIESSSNQGDVLLDPFAGCGTTIHAAQNLGRRWIGIDVCVNACRIIEERVKSHFDSLWDDIEFIGIPKTAADAKTLASLDPFRFERWGASLVDGMEANIRQRGDKGIDGWGRIPIRKGHFIDVVSPIKGGSTGPGHVQAFNGARQQAGADLGIFTCFDERVTPKMRDAAASAGRFMDVPTVQIYTIEDYFEGRRPLMPTAV